MTTRLKRKTGLSIGQWSALVTITIPLLSFVLYREADFQNLKDKLQFVNERIENQNKQIDDVNKKIDDIYNYMFFAQRPTIYKKTK